MLCFSLFSKVLFSTKVVYQLKRPKTSKMSHYAATANAMFSSSPVIRTTTIQEQIEQEEDPVLLNDSWSFWLEKSDYGAPVEKFEQSLKKIYEVSTVEGFWSVYNNIPQPSAISNRYTYHLMRGNRKPMWEDPAHNKGGNWKMKCDKSFSDNVWKELLLAAIGEILSESVVKGDEIGGISINVRERDDVIQIWNTDAALSDQAEIEDKVQQLLPEARFSATFYKPFEAHTAYQTGK